MKRKRFVPMTRARVEAGKNIKTVMEEPVALQSDEAEQTGKVAEE